MNENDIDAVIELPVISLESSIVLPHMSLPLELDSIKETAVRAAAADDMQVLLLFITPGGKERPLSEQFYEIGVVAQLRSGMSLGGVELLIEGKARAQLLDIVQTEPYIRCRCLPVADPPDWDDEVEELQRELLALIETFVKLMPDLPDSILNFVQSLDHPGILADNTGYTPEMPLETRIELLRAFDLKERLQIAIEFFRGRAMFAQIQTQIREQTQEGIENSQREYYLREQMAAIRRNLGESGDSEIAEYRQRIEASGMHEEALKEATRELSRLERLPAQAPEYSVIKSYLDWLCDLPWNKLTEDDLDISRARQVLDEDHYGLQEVKDRILEFLSIRKLALDRGLDLDNKTASTGGAILCFVGPPGVGKTSLGRSIARALGREFTRMSLGGMRDEAEIRGHRRTYIGAIPGRIIQAIRRVGTRNPVFMLDEVDKIGTDWRGDPASALLEALDPEQNTQFRDHYLDVDFDLSQVLFITTANLLNPIPLPLQDRMDILRLDGYVEPEKVQIAQRYLVPRQLKANSLYEDEVQFREDALHTIIRHHTREAGVRQLEREIGRVARKLATRIAEEKMAGPVTVDADEVRQLLGKPHYFLEAMERTETPGVATGLSVTVTGGDIMFVEATRMAGNGRLTLTGQLGDVLKESANLAQSYLRTRATSFGIDETVFEKSDVHLHLPAGAIPKDGPSAGVAIVTALVSLLTALPADGEVGMTGEITLRGRVLPVGGIKRKVLAAHRAGLKKVLLPRRNEADLDDLPPEVRSELEIVLVETIDELLPEVLPQLQSSPKKQAG